MMCLHIIQSTQGNMEQLRLSLLPCQPLYKNPCFHANHCIKPHSTQPSSWKQTSGELEYPQRHQGATKEGCRWVYCGLKAPRQRTREPRSKKWYPVWPNPNGAKTQRMRDLLFPCSVLAILCLYVACTCCTAGAGPCLRIYGTILSICHCVPSPQIMTNQDHVTSWRPKPFIRY
jgi:hypothetical protein